LNGLNHLSSHGFKEATGLSEVIIHDDENFERALKRFKKKCEKAGILSDLRKHRHYEKPSERRKRKMNAARRKGRRTRHV
jgi:small subunit ribosomal protein S21